MYICNSTAKLYTSIQLQQCDYSIHKIQYSVCLFALTVHLVRVNLVLYNFSLFSFSRPHHVSNWRSHYIVRKLFLLIIQLRMVSFMPFPLFIKSELFFTFPTRIFQFQWVHLHVHSKISFISTFLSTTMIFTLPLFAVCVNVCI